MTKRCEIPEISMGDIVNVIIRETGQPIRTGNPITVEKMAYYNDSMSVYATESNGTERIFKQNKFKFLKV